MKVDLITLNVTRIITNNLRGNHGIIAKRGFGRQSFYLHSPSDTTRSHVTVQLIKSFPLYNSKSQIITDNTTTLSEASFLQQYSSGIHNSVTDSQGQVRKSK